MQSTRQRILQILKERNLATIEELSQTLQLTPVTIRHHLDILRGEGLVGAPQTIRRAGPGRPQHAFGLTPAASEYFPKNYHGLTNVMLEEIRERLSPAEMEHMMNNIAQRMAADAPSPTANQTPQEIMRATVNYLNAKGYIARWEQTSNGDFVLHTCNCPYERVSQAHTEVCSMDTSLVSRLVGVAGERVSHLGSGDESCTYLFRF